MDKETVTVHTEQHNATVANCLILLWKRGYDLYNFFLGYNSPSTSSINASKEKLCETLSSWGPAYFPLSDLLKHMSRPTLPTRATFFSLTALTIQDITLLFFCFPFVKACSLLYNLLRWL